MELEVRISFFFAGGGGGGWWLVDGKGTRRPWGRVNVLFLNLSSGYTDIFSFSKLIEWYTCDRCTFLYVCSLPQSDGQQNSIPWSFHFGD